MSDEKNITEKIKSGRQRLFTVIAIAIPVFVLLFAEGLLRLAGFGDDYPLFIELEPRPQYLQPNPDIIKRFFSNPDEAPAVSIDTGYFLAQKPDNGLRIVVQGGSSAAGFPYGKNASPAGMLQQRLSRSFPDRTVEVILTAMSAVNSWTLLEFADEIIAQRPDAIVIYAGHNEFLGVLGVGSAFGGGRSPAITRLFLELRSLRLFQLAQSTVGLFKPDRERRGATLMATIARERSIALDSDLFRLGVKQFQDNLDALLARYAAASIPVFIGTLASNEKDQPPFIGSPAEPDETWANFSSAARAALADGQTGAASDAAENLLTRYPDMADAHFLQGRASLALGENQAARRAFQSAIDRDRLRFRAPGHFQKVIRDSAARHGATVVEVHERLAGATADGLIGHELMLEHLHPNTDGYYLLGEAFFDALEKAGLGLDWSGVIDTGTARAEQPLTRIEALHGAYRVAALTKDWPFVDEKQDFVLPAPAGPEDQIAQAWYSGQLDWLRAMNQGLVHNQRAGDFEEAARIAINLADAFPFEGQPQHVAGMMLVRQTPPQGLRALPYFHRAVTLEPRSAPFLATLARAYLINGYPGAARSAAERLLQLTPENETARQIIEHLDNNGGP